MKERNFMEYNLDTATELPGEMRKTYLLKILYVIIFLTLCTFSFFQINKRKAVTAPAVDTTEIVSKNNEGEMSAMRFTTLPFVLAFRHYVADRDE